MEERQVCIEIFKQKNHSNYALLGCKYIKSLSPLRVEVFIAKSSESNGLNNFCAGESSKHKGIIKEYMNYIIAAVERFFNEKEGYINGILMFNIGAHCEIGSSGKIFEEATIDLLNVLLLNKVEEENELKKALVD